MGLAGPDIGSDSQRSVSRMIPWINLLNNRSEYRVIPRPRDRGDTMGGMTNARWLSMILS